MAEQVTAWWPLKREVSEVRQIQVQTQRVWYVASGVVETFLSVKMRTALCTHGQCVAVRWANTVGMASPEPSIQ